MQSLENCRPKIAAELNVSMLVEGKFGTLKKNLKFLIFREIFRFFPHIYVKNFPIFKEKNQEKFEFSLIFRKSFGEFFLNKVFFPNI